MGPDRHEISIQSGSVTRIYVASSFDVQFVQDDAVAAVRIANPLAVVVEHTRPKINLRGDEFLRAVDLGVFGNIVISGDKLRVDRTLEVVFFDGVLFWVEPLAEATATGPMGNKGLLLISMPGNDLAVWFGSKRKRAAKVAPATTIAYASAIGDD